jgi:heme A synthase
MLKRLRTEFIFAVAGGLGLLSVALVLRSGVQWIPFLVLAFGFIVWALVKSETEGFIKIHGMPRAGDPQREFHPLQSFILLVIVILQVAIGAYMVVTNVRVG